MKRAALPLAFVLILCSCASLDTGSAVAGDLSETSPMASWHTGGRWITRPSGGGLTVIGIAGRQRKPEDEIAQAREDAARKIALFHGLRGQVAHVNQTGPGSLDWFADSDVSLDYDTDYEQYLAALSYDPQKDVLVIDGAVFVRFSYPAFLPGTLDYAAGQNAAGAPEWTTRPPAEIGPYMAGVGFARPQRRLQDTYIRSCESAAAGMISRLSTRIITETTDSSRSGTASSFSSLSEGELSQFYVLETWQDPSTKGVWTLAIATPK